MVIQVEAPSGWRTVSQMARELGADTSALSRRVSRLGYQPRQYSKVGVVRDHYPPECLEELRLFRQKVKTCLPADDWLTIRQLHLSLGRTWEWTASRLATLAIQPEERATRFRRIDFCYPPQTLVMLKAISQAHPASGDWVTINAIARLIGAHRHRVVTWLKEIDARPEARLMPHMGIVADHYPPEAVRQLTEIWQAIQAACPPADGWLTRNALARQIGCSRDWVLNRIGAFEHLAEDRKGSTGAIRIHYPLSVLEELRRQRPPAPSKPHNLSISPRGKLVFAMCKPCRWMSQEGFETHARVVSAFEEHTMG